jgi:hypothetical protein
MELTSAVHSLLDAGENEVDSFGMSLDEFRHSQLDDQRDFHSSKLNFQAIVEELLQCLALVVDEEEVDFPAWTVAEGCEDFIANDSKENFKDVSFLLLPLVVNLDGEREGTV